MSEQGLAQLGAAGRRSANRPLGRRCRPRECLSAHGHQCFNVVGLAAVEVAGQVAALLSRSAAVSGQQARSHSSHLYRAAALKAAARSPEPSDKPSHTQSTLKPQLPDTPRLLRDYTLAILGRRSSVRITQGAFQSGLDFSRKA
jgi:hypothetical protein